MSIIENSDIEPKERYMRYIPHGISTDEFFPIDKEDNEDYKNFLDEFYNNNYENYEYIILYNNRNIKRKMPGDVIMSYKEFVDGYVPEEKYDNVLLLLHTDPVDKAGTDLRRVHQDIAPYVNISFSTRKYETEILNYMYNSVDVTVNISNNEGYGLATAESLMTETPIISTVTGGLQDQMGFEGVLNQEKFDKDNKPECGSWAYPVWPRTRNLQGSPPTPYIFSDYIYYKDVADGFNYWYQKTDKERKEAGKEGHKYLIEQGHTVENMVEKFDEELLNMFENWEERERVQTIQR